VGKRLAAKGHDFYLYSVNPGWLPEREKTAEGMTVVRAPGNVPAHLLVPKAIREVGPDVVVDDLAHVVPWFSPLFTSRPVVAFFRHLHARSLPGQVNPVMAAALSSLERAYPLVYRKSTFVTETATGVRDLTSLGVKEERVLRILPGVSERLKPLEKAERPTLIYFGGMRDYKRPWGSVAVLGELLKRGVDAYLVVVGEGPSLPKVVEAAKPVKERVKFAGRVSDEELFGLLGRAWVNLHFSVTEGFGLSLVEAARCGTPSVAADAPGVSEVIREFGIGMVGRDVGEMASEVAEVIADRERWERRALEGARPFSWDASARKWEELFEGLLAAEAQG